jgi:hypothetical protein
MCTQIWIAMLNMSKAQRLRKLYQSIYLWYKGSLADLA